MAQLLHTEHLDLRALIPFPNPMNLVLQAAIQTDIDLGSSAKFKEVTFEVRPRPQRFNSAASGCRS